MLFEILFDSSELRAGESKDERDQCSKEKGSFHHLGQAGNGIGELGQQPCGDQLLKPFLAPSIIVNDERSQKWQGQQAPQKSWFTERHGTLLQIVSPRTNVAPRKQRPAPKSQMKRSW